MNLLKKIMNKKFIGILLAVVILFNVISPNIVTPKAYAIDVAGILLYPLTFLVAMLAEAALAIINLVDKSGVLGGNNLFIDSIVFNKLPIFQVNIFDPSLSTESAFMMGSGAMLASIQKWYYITRTIAIAASFVILVYVAIKILISTAAGDKAKYKSLLKDWLLSLLLIFAMHFLMAGILFAADALTNAIASIAQSSASGNMYEVLKGKALAGNSDSIIYAIMMWVLIIVTFAFVVIYAKRVIMIAFLTVFAPLVALSYSIDKIKDGQSQVLDKWMKEYIYTALMMPLDAMLYAVLSDTLVACLTDPNGNFIFGLALVIGYLPLRGWFNEFLGTDKAGHGMAGVAAGALVGSAISSISGGKGKKGSSTSNEVDSAGGNNAVEGGEGKSHEIETKASSNPLLNTGADKPKVSSPTSAAAVTSNVSAEMSAGQKAAATRANSRIHPSLKGTANLYGKGLGMVAGATAGLAMTALTGNAAAGIGTGVGIAKAANKGNAGGLGGKLVGGISNTVGGAGGTVAATASYMRDRMRTGGIVNAMGRNGSLEDIENAEERQAALEWANNNINEDTMAAIEEMKENGEIDSGEADDMIFRAAIRENKAEIKETLADERFATRANRREESKQTARVEVAKSQLKNESSSALVRNMKSGATALSTNTVGKAKRGNENRKLEAAENKERAAKKNEIKGRR